MTTHKNHKTASAATCETPTISPIIGEGSAAHRLVRVGAWSFTAQVGEEEPRIRDLDLAEKLGYARPRDIRKLIKDLRVAGKLNGSAHRDEQARRDGQVAARPVTEFWLTEAQALKVIAKSETVAADAILDEMIRVFMLARRGLLDIRPANDVDIGRVVDAAMERRMESMVMILTAMQERMVANETALIRISGAIGEMAQAMATGHALAIDTNKLIRQVASRDGTIPGDEADKIREMIALLIDLRAIKAGTAGNNKAKAAIRGDIYADLWAYLDWGRKGQGLREMPAEKGPLAKTFLAYQIRRIRKGEAKASTATAKKQIGLFDDKAN